MKRVAFNHQVRHSRPDPLPPSAKRGRLKKWFADQGYGFIYGTQPGSDIFVHMTSLVDPSREPREGDEVRYVTGMRNGKIAAIAVEIVR